MKKAFTIVEMIIVVGILGILMATLVASLSGGTDSARAAKCLANMKGLASACQIYGAASGYYPLAGSIEKLEMKQKRGGNGVQRSYYELAGWISWNSGTTYQSEKTSSAASMSWYTSLYNTDDAARDFTITNGVLWKYVNRNHDIYVCPEHAIKMKKMNPNWSYVMNGHFGWHNTGKSRAEGYHGVGFSGLGKAERRLLFAEIPFFEPKSNERSLFPNLPNVPTDTGSGQPCDCILQYRGLKGTASPETIGFNHKKGKDLFAHVCFADGHVEKIACPKSGDLQELTQWLCEGRDITYNASSKRYEKIEN